MGEKGARPEGVPSSLAPGYQLLEQNRRSDGKEREDTHQDTSPLLVTQRGQGRAGPGRLGDTPGPWRLRRWAGSGLGRQLEGCGRAIGALEGLGTLRAVPHGTDTGPMERLWGQVAQGAARVSTTIHHRELGVARVLQLHNIADRVIGWQPHRLPLQKARGIPLWCCTGC